MKISVVVPVYNVSNYVPRCIETICSQTYSDLELILVDDGSTDGSFEICNRYAKKDQRIKVVHENNSGPIKARKLGSELATGEYITFVDSDDWIETDYIEKLYCGLQKKDTDMVISLSYIREFKDGSSLEVIPDNNTNIEEEHYEKSEFEKYIWPNFLDINDITRHDIPVSTVMKLYKTDFFKKCIGYVSEDISISDDDVTTFICLLNADSVNIINKSGYHYRIRYDSMSNIKRCDKAHIESIRKAQDNIFRYLDSSDFTTERKRFFKKKWYISSYYALMVTAGKYFSNLNSEFLFPYPEVKNGSRVLVYALSSYGRDLIDFLDSSTRFTLAGASDRMFQKSCIRDDIVPGKKIITYTPAEIATAGDYDYVVITTSRTNTTEAIRRYLISTGVDKDKIATIDNTLFKRDPFKKQENE